MLAMILLTNVSYKCQLAFNVGYDLITNKCQLAFNVSYDLKCRNYKTYNSTSSGSGLNTSKLYHVSHIYIYL